MTWPEVETCLDRGACALLPMGSTEQHGPMGLVGTDAICAAEVARRAGEICDAIVVPELAYTPAPFNTGFPGTLSIPADLTRDLVHEICAGLLSQGFKGVFIVNGHGANLEPVAQARARLPDGSVEVQSWWAPAEVMALRDARFGEWEGMHATPSEVAITQTLLGCKPPGAAATPPQKLSADYIKAHGGDRHGPPDAHRAAFPDGRVGSHSALATPEIGAELLETASAAIARAFQSFCKSRGAG
ncbi:MAG: creatininase family protein [Pseudomonadota bacterium]